MSGGHHGMVATVRAVQGGLEVTKVGPGAAASGEAAAARASAAAGVEDSVECVKMRVHQRHTPILLMKPQLSGEKEVGYVAK